MHMILEFLTETVDIQVYLLSIADKIVITQVFSVGIQEIVHFPKFPLSAGGLRGLGSQLRIRMRG